jgi:hypothetical protein
MPLNTFVGPDAVKVYDPTTNAGPLPSVVLVNNSTSTLYVGGAEVTQYSGLPFPAGNRIEFPHATFAVWAVCGSTTTTPSTTLSAAATEGTNTVTVVSATGFSAGMSISIGTGASAETAVIASIATNTFTLTANLGFDHASGEAVAATAPATTSLGGGTVTVFRGKN